MPHVYCSVCTFHNTPTDTLEQALSDNLALSDIANFSAHMHSLLEMTLGISVAVSPPPLPKELLPHGEEA